MLAVALLCSCSKEENDVFYQEASGNVKSIRTTMYEADNTYGKVKMGDVQDDQRVNTLVTFNRDGYATEKCYFTPTGEQIKKEVYDFKYVGKWSRATYYNGEDEKTGYLKCTYGENKRLAKIVEYDENGDIVRKFDYTWENANKMKAESSSFNGEYMIWEYKKKAPVKVTHYDEDGKKTGFYTKYENSRITKIVNPDYTTRIKYNDEGYCASVTNGQWLMPRYFIQEKGVTYSYKYKYDDEGNWIEMVERNKETDEATRIIVREIEYY